MTFLTQFGSNQTISKKVKIFVFSVCLCVKLWSRAHGVQLKEPITFSRKNISSSPTLRQYLQTHRLSTESLSQKSCSRKEKCNFYETLIFGRFRYFFPHILSHRHQFSEPYTQIVRLGVWNTYANFQLKTSFQSRVLYYT